MVLSSAWALVASHSLPYATLEVRAYCTQNTSTLTSTVYTELGVRCATYTYSADGVKAGITGASDISWGYTQFGSNAYHKLTGGSYTVSHNSTTGAASTTIYYWLDQTFGGDIASSANPARVTVDLPTIFVKPPAGNASTITYSASTSPTSITISMAGGTPGAGGSVSYYRIKWNGASSYSKVSNPAVFGGLTPDTSYSFSIDFVDNYGTIAAGSVSGTAYTVLPSTPLKGVVSARSVTDTSAVVSWMGFLFATGATWGKYQYKIGSGSWIDYSTNQNLFLTGLTPSTQYTVYVRLVDNFGTASDAASVTFTTQEKKKWASGSVFIKVDGVWKRGTVYYKSNDAWVKYNGAFIKKEN